MARTVASLPAGSRITDYISLGVIAKTFPPAAIRLALEKTNKTSVRQRDLPAHVVFYYVIALALYMASSYREVLRCLLEAIQWLRDPSVNLKAAGKSGISQARTRLGWEPLGQLHDEIVQPIAVKGDQGDWYRVWRLVRHPRAHARSGAQSRRGSGPSLFLARRAGCPPQVGRLQRNSPPSSEGNFS